MIKSLGSYMSSDGFGGWYIYNGPNESGPLDSVASFLPHVLTLGDIPHFAASIVPRRLLVLDPVNGDKSAMSVYDAQGAFTFTQTVYGGYKAGDSSYISIQTGVADSAISSTVANWLSTPTACTILTGDLNSDCYVNFNDVYFLCQCWLSYDDACANAFSFNGIVDFWSFATIGLSWMQCTVPADPNCW
jgi:hypothetical protein